MKKMVIGVSALLGLIAAPALAADLPVKAPPPSAEPVWSWTGVYIGANGGWGWSDVDQITLFNNFGASVGFAMPQPTGGFAGGQIGANYQFGFLVIGAELNGDWANIHQGIVNYPQITTGFGSNFLTANYKIDAFGSIRGRAGLAWGPVLFFATGGAAEARVHAFQNVTSPPTPFAAPGFFDATAHGAVWGGGVEVGFARNWTARFEYQNFTNMGNYSIAAPVVPPNGIIIHSNLLSNNFQTVSFALNYKFDWLGGGPVVARY
jgi:outer membrane immunogenic protein